MKINTRTFAAASLLAASLSLTANAVAEEVMIGEPVEMHGMEIGAVYLQPVMMTPELPGMGDKDIHLEADIVALPLVPSCRWSPFDVEWDFTFVGTGKKGGY